MTRNNITAYIKRAAVEFRHDGQQPSSPQAALEQQQASYEK